MVRQSSGIFGNYNDPPAFDAAWTQDQPPAQRSSREELIAAANAYFDGIQQGNGDIVPLADGCIRVENGVQTAPQPPKDGHPAESIRESFNSKRFSYIREIRPRRVMLVDEERNTVYGIFSFQHPGNIGTHDPTFQKSLSKPDSVLVYPNTIEIAESFHLHAGKITHITALMVMLPYGQPHGLAGLQAIAASLRSQRPSMCSNRRPFVSGTNFSTNRPDSRLIAPYSQYAKAWLNAAFR